MRLYRKAHKKEGLEQKKIDYYKHREKRLIEARKYTLAHPEQREQILIRYRQNNKGNIAMSNVRWRLKREYGLSLEDYEKMGIRQGLRCGICNKSQTENKTKLCVDHCHKTGKIRALLCHDCNVGLGRFKDDPELLFNAIRYLQISHV